MHFLFSISLASLAFALAPPAPAQHSKVNLAVGLAVTKSVSTFNGAIHTQRIDGQCQGAINLCPNVGTPTDGVTGGTAYDARLQALWISTGKTIQHYILNGCRSLFTLSPSLLNRSAKVTGLAISDRHRRLYHLETTIGYIGIKAYDMTTLPPKPITGGWSTKLNAVGATGGGLAFDEVNDRLYVAVSFGAFHGFMSDLYVLDPSGSMSLVIKTNIPMVTRPGGPRSVTGLAYDSGSNLIYATDGGQTLVGLVGDPDKGTVTWSKIACNKNLAGNYVGLAIIPGWSQVSLGANCLGAPCANCTGMTNSAVGGDPVLGNSHFSVQLNNAPLGAAAFLILGGGACTTGTNIPILCGPLFTAFYPPPLIVGPLTLTGSTSCGGFGSAPLPIPVEAVLAGAKFCAQWVVACQKSTSLGLGVSKALEFNITGG